MTRVRPLTLIFAALLLLAGGTLGRPPQAHFWWESLPDVYAIFGFGGASLMILGFLPLAERLLIRADRTEGAER